MEQGKADRYHLKVVIPIFFLIIVLFFSAWVRFDGITEVGIHSGDSSTYMNEAKRWAGDQQPRFLGNRFYRPVSYFLQGTAIRIFGYNDYSIKILHSVMDMFSILLIFIIATILAGNLWAGTMSSLIYAFLPGVVTLARLELPYTESTFFVLLSFLFFVLSDKRKAGNGFKYFLLAMSGLSSGLAANTHPDLAFLAPGYVLYLFIVSYDSQNKIRWLKKFLILSSIFTFFFFAPYLVGFFIFGTQKVLQVFFNEIQAGTSLRTSMFGRDSKPAIFFSIFYGLIKYFFGKPFLLTVILLVAAAPIMIYRKIKKEKDTPRAHLPLTLVLSYAFLYLFFLNTSPKPSVLMSLLPMIIFIITLWFYKIFKQHLGKYAVMVFVCFFFILFLLNPKTLPGETANKSLFRFVYDELKNDVDKENKLMIAPVPVWDGRGFKLDLYFGNKNAIYMRDLPIEDEYNLNTLSRLLKKKRLRYILVKKNVQKVLLNPGFLPPKIFRGWLRNEKFHYSLEKDLEIIRDYIRSRSGILISDTNYGTLYCFTDDKTPGLIKNGSFEYWRQGIPLGDWKRISGNVSKAGEATHGSHSMCLEPDGENVTRVTWRYENTPQIPGTRLKLRVRLDMKAGKPGEFFFYFRALVGKNWQRLKPGIVKYTGNGEWVTFSGDIEPVNDMRSLILDMWLRKVANKPAFIDNISITPAAQQVKEILGR